MQDEEMYDSQTEGEDNLCNTGVGCNVPDVQVSKGSRAKGMVLERHMQQDVGSSSIDGSACCC